MKRGDRIRYSRHGINTLLPKFPGRGGVVVGDRTEAQGHVHVIWDGNKTRTGIAVSFIELDIQPKDGDAAQESR